jgi:hypothetical protein
MMGIRVILEKLAIRVLWVIEDIMVLWVRVERAEQQVLLDIQDIQEIRAILVQLDMMVCREGLVQLARPVRPEMMVILDIHL